MVRPVSGHDDLSQFIFDFVPTGKSLADGSTAPVVTETEDGDLIIEGYAAVFEGVDREGENFTDGAFQRGIKSFLDGQSGLCYHHKHDKLLGKVLELEEEPGKGLRMKARVDGAIRTHPELGTYYQQIKKGSLNALSVGGFFRRKLTEAGQKINNVDLTEISITPVPVHAGTSFSVVAGKALEEFTPVAPAAEFDFSGIEASLQSLVDVFGDTKALPSTHDHVAAQHIHDLLGHVSSARELASVTREHAKHPGLKSAANALETDLVAHGKKLHGLAAKVGPLPSSRPY